MIRVQNFLLIDKEFVSLDDFRGNIPDPNYIEGAVCLDVNGTQVLTLEMWDLIDQLWAYVVQGLEEIQQQNAWRTYFPDQPLELSFKTDARRQIITIEVNPDTGSIKASAQYDEFFSLMGDEARNFFLKMKQIAPANQNTYDSCLEQIESLYVIG